jgi:hypothetical protein
LGSAAAVVSFFFLPPITPKPPRGFFCVSRGWGGGAAGFGGDIMEVRLRRGAGSASGSDSVAVASSASAADARGDGTAFLIFGLASSLLN